MNTLTADFSLPLGLRQLLRMRSMAKLYRLKRRMLAPRRLTLTILAVVLGLFWAAQALMGILFRPAADPERLRSWITGGLVFYGFWHLLRSVWTKDVEGIAWSRSEREMLWSAPLSRGQLLAYRVAGLVGPAMLKAGLLTIVLLPDSARPELTFLGLLLSLSILELGRMVIETGCSVAAPSTARRFKAGVTSIAVALVVALGMGAWSHWNPSSATAPAVQLPGLILSGLRDLSGGPVIQFLGQPLSPLANTATAMHWNTNALLGIAVATSEILGLILLLVWLDRRIAQNRLLREQAQYDSLITGTSQQSCEQPNVVATQARLPLSNSGGLGAVVARQLLTLRGYWVTVLITLLVPAAMATFPLWTLPLNQPVLVHIVGSLIFYTLLLGPPALKIDFRRDSDRMLMLRLLPMSPLRITIGQLALPVLACLAFQVLVLGITMAVRPVEFSAILLALLVLIPLTIFVFAMENAIFLNFPQRIGQEGIEVLVRTTLVFTFKSLLCVAGFALAIAWTVMTKKLVGEAYQPLVYRIGGLTMLWSIASISLWATATAFKHYDVSMDTPAD